MVTFEIRLRELKEADCDIAYIMTKSGWKEIHDYAHDFSWVDVANSTVQTTGNEKIRCGRIEIKSKKYKMIENG